jgi:hypothetical protein
MLAGFGVLGAILWLAPWLRVRDASALSWAGSSAQIVALIFWGLGVALLGLSRGPRPVARTVYVVWMSVAVPIGVVMTTILLTVLFVVLLPLFSLVVRFSDPLRKKLMQADSYWEDYPRYEPTLERMRRPF